MSEVERIATALCEHYSRHRIVGKGVVIEHRQPDEPMPCASCCAAARALNEHKAESDVPRSSWLEAVIRAAVIDWNSNPDKVEGDVSLYLTRSIWPVLQEDRAQVWDECAEEAHALGWLHDFGSADMHARNPYRRPEHSSPPGETS